MKKTYQVSIPIWSDFKLSSANKAQSESGESLFQYGLISNVKNNEKKIWNQWGLYSNMVWFQTYNYSETQYKWVTKSLFQYGLISNKQMRSCRCGKQLDESLFQYGLISNLWKKYGLPSILTSLYSNMVWFQTFKIIHHIIPASFNWSLFQYGLISNFMVDGMTISEEEVSIPIWSDFKLCSIYCFCS